MVDLNEKNVGLNYFKIDMQELFQSSPNISLNNIHFEITNTSNKKLKKHRKIATRKGKWTEQEDKLLEQWVKTHGAKDWDDCSEFIPGRNSKQCREHWMNCLNPELLKGYWTPEEDVLIFYFYQICNGSWNKIIPLFKNRIQNSVKNRFYSKLRKCATKKVNRKDRKKIRMKIKLDELKNYINEALIDAKTYLLYKTKMTEEQFNLFIEKNKQKLKDNINLEIDNSETNSSINLDVSNTKQNLNDICINKNTNMILDDKNINNDINLNKDINIDNNLLFEYKFDKRRYEFGSKYLNDNIHKFLKNYSYVYRFTNFYNRNNNNNK